MNWERRKESHSKFPHVFSTATSETTRSSRASSASSASGFSSFSASSSKFPCISTGKNGKERAGYSEVQVFLGEASRNSTRTRGQMRQGSLIHATTKRELCTTELADQTAKHVRIFMQIGSNEANKLTQFNSEERRKKDTDETDRGKLPKVSKSGGRGHLKLVS